MISPHTPPGTHVVANRPMELFRKGQTYVCEAVVEIYGECVDCKSPFYAVLKDCDGDAASICALDYAALPKSLTGLLTGAPIREGIEA